jgi:hypothetical protein
MSKLREAAYQIDPVLWVREVLGIEPAPWQMEFLRAPLGASVIALTARQVGKTTAATWAIAHHMVFTPGGLSVVACPSHRQSAEALRRVHEILIAVGAELRTDNVYALELKNGSRVLALPGSHDSIRGMTVDGWIVADEAAQLTTDLISALRPMRARRRQARFAMLSTAWSRTDPFWSVWDSDDPSWLRLRATAEIPGLLDAEYLAQERRAMGEHDFKREYLGIPTGADGSLFTWEMYDLATRIHVPLVRPGAAFDPPVQARGDVGRPATFNHDDPATWPGFMPPIIAHDVGRSHDRSTAVIGGLSPFRPLIGAKEFIELPQNQFGSARASALAAVDRRYHSEAIIVADLSNDASYAENLWETFGPRVIGVQIGRYGSGMEFERRAVSHGAMLVYQVGRNYLLEHLRAEIEGSQLKLVPSEDSRRAFEQLVRLETEMRESGTVYRCPSGQHDDLGISLAMLVWAAKHPHRESWMGRGQAARRHRPKRQAPSSLAWT